MGRNFTREDFLPLLREVEATAFKAGPKTGRLVW